MKTNLFRNSAIFKKTAKPLAVCIVAIFAVSMLSALLTTQAATANLSSGVWINAAHYNTGDMGTYNIQNTQGALSASGIPNLDNLYLPAEIGRGYNRWDANGGYFNLQNTPYLSFDIWVDRSLEIEVGLVDTSNGGWVGGYNTLIGDTYHSGQANTPPYNNLYGVSTTPSPDGAWMLMVGPSDGSTTHYTIDLRTLGCSLGHIGQIIFDVTAMHQSDIHWKIHNVVVSSDGSASGPAPTTSPTVTPTVTPKPTAAPTATPTATPQPTATATPKPTATATPTPTATPSPTTTPTTTPAPTATPTQQPTVRPTPTSKPTATPSPTTSPPQTSTNPTPAPSTTTTPTQPPVTYHHYWWWSHFNWPHFWFFRTYSIF